MIVQDIFKEIVSKVQYDNKLSTVRFFFEYWPSISAKIIAEGRSKTLGKQYPMIMLHADCPENHDKPHVTEINPVFYIILDCQATDDISYQIEKKYKPILYPIYENFLIQIRQSQSLFQTQLLEHEKSDLYYINSLTADQNKINDVVCAIEVKFKNLLIKQKNL
jgi:hypothetical protein